MARCTCESHVLARQIKKQTVPFFLRWIPDGFFPRIGEAVSAALSNDGAADHCRVTHRPGPRRPLIMPFDLEHYIEDHSYSGEHDRPR
jgi:hypothetical protein